MKCTKQERLYQDPYSCKHKDQGNPCFRGNWWEDTYGKMLKKLVNHVLDGSAMRTTSNTESNKKVINIKSALADGAYHSNANFQIM